MNMQHITLDVETYMPPASEGAQLQGPLRLVCLTYTDGQHPTRLVARDEAIRLFYGWLHDPNVRLSGHNIAFDLLVFHAASRILAKSLLFTGLDIRFLPGSTASSADLETPASAQFTKIEKGLPSGWLKGKTEAECFERFRKLAEEEKRDILAFCVASTVRPSLAPSDPTDTRAYEAALALTDVDVAEYWRPSKSSFLGRLTREQLLAKKWPAHGWMPCAMRIRTGCISTMSATSGPTATGWCAPSIRICRTISSPSRKSPAI